MKFPPAIRFLYFLHHGLIRRHTCDFSASTCSFKYAVHCARAESQTRLAARAREYKLFQRTVCFHYSRLSWRPVLGLGKQSKNQDALSTAVALIHVSTGKQSVQTSTCLVVGECKGSVMGQVPSRSLAHTLQSTAQWPLRLPVNIQGL